MKNTFLILLFSFIQLTFAQNNLIKGHIKNGETGTSLGYVNIGIKNKSIGTVADSLGNFVLKLNDKIRGNDTLIFTAIGFKDYKIIVEKARQNTNIQVQLAPEAVELQGVIVDTKKPKKCKIGRTVKGLSLMHFNFYSAYEASVDDRVSKEVGMKFKTKDFCRIKDLNFNISGNDFKKLKFRLNFYKVENNSPTVSLLGKDIFFDVLDNYTGWFTVDLTSYKIVTGDGNEEFVVSLQWIESEKATDKSKYFSISDAQSLNKNFYYKEKAQDSWINGSMALSFYLNAVCN